MYAMPIKSTVEKSHHDFANNSPFFVAFNEGRTLPNLLGCLLSRRFPVHASES